HALLEVCEPELLVCDIELRRELECLEQHLDRAVGLAGVHVYTSEHAADGGRERIVRACSVELCNGFREAALVLEADRERLARKRIRRIQLDCAPQRPFCRRSIEVVDEECVAEG